MFGPQVPHEIWRCEEHGILRGLCLITTVDEADGLFTLKTKHLGTSGESDDDGLCVEYNRLLTDDTYRSPFAFALLQKLRDDNSWDRLHLSGLAPEEAQVWIAGEPDMDFRIAESPFFDLKQAREEQEPVMKYLGSNTRNDMKRKLKAWGELQVDWAEAGSQAEEIFHELVELHQARWNAAGMPGSFASVKFHDFHQQLIQDLLPKGKVSLVRVRQGTRTVGCVLSYAERGTLLFYQMGASAEAARLSPGLVSIYITLEEALRRGYDRFDYLAGEGEHKRRFSTHANKLYWGKLQRRRWKTTLMEKIRFAKQVLVRE